ncbi:MAG: hypothetical protein ACKV0T_22725 [Planctomycetales bacterium]
MRWLCINRAARLAAAACFVVMIAGCPSLNQWSGPSQDPFLSVMEPVKAPRPDSPRLQLTSTVSTLSEGMPASGRGAPGPDSSSAIDESR